MSSCQTPACCSTAHGAPAEACPRCGSRGSTVDVITLKALLTSTALPRGIPPLPRFCATASCDVVYFSNDPAVEFRAVDLLVPVHAKQPENETVPVCYCFGHTSRSIREEIEASGSSTATPSITAQVKAGLCACEVRNPKGSCCLGDIVRVERRLTSIFSLSKTQERHGHSQESNETN